MRCKTTRSLLCASFVWLLLSMTASAQTTNANHDFDPLHQFNGAVRKLVKQVTPSVVQVQVTGYAPVENGTADTGAIVGMSLFGGKWKVAPSGFVSLTSATNRHRYIAKISVHVSRHDRFGDINSRRE